MSLPPDVWGSWDFGSASVLARPRFDGAMTFQVANGGKHSSLLQNRLLADTKTDTKRVRRSIVK
jgi:hypothetical protein